MTDLVLGKGRLYFEKFLPNSRVRSGEGFAYFGNTPELTVSVEEEKQEHFSSEGGLNVKDASVVTSTTTGGGFTTDHISIANLALWYRGEKGTLTQLPGVGASDEWTVVKRGNYFQLGETADAVQGARKVSNVTAEKGANAATDTVTFSTAPPVANDTVTINGVVATYKAAPAGPDEIAIGANLTAAAQNLKAWVNSNVARLKVVASGAAAVITLTAAAKGTPGNAITVAKTAATAANITVATATLTGGTGTAVAGDANFTVKAATGLVYVKPDAPDLVDGDSLVFTYDQAGTTLNVVTSGNAGLEGRLMFVADNGYGDNKDHLWPYVQISADGDYSLIGDDWQAMSFTYEVLKLDDETPREIITDRGS